ncbi:MAG: CaiB/BaiF CoA transferase family protein [Thermoplasmataceae archaeon]
MYRVIELGHIVAGPTAGLIMAEMGFEVIKIERPVTGDISRSLVGQSAGSFPYYNRMKKSITLNLKSHEGVEILRKLIKSADILIDNFSSDFLKNIDLGYDRIHELNSRIIYVTIRGYRSANGIERKSLDYPIEIDSGIAYMTGLNNRPLRVGASLVDMFSATMAVIGTYQALLDRERTGEGKMIDSSLFQNAMFMIGQHIATYQVTGKELDPINESGFAWGIYDFFNTLDGKKIFIAVTTDAQWEKFSEILNLEKEYVVKYRTNKIRFENRNVLIPELQKYIEKFDSGAIEKLLNSKGIVYSFLRRPWDLLTDTLAIQHMNSVKFEGKEMYMPSVPVSDSRSEHVPELGENNVEILRSLGYSDIDISHFRKNGFI